MTTQIKLTFPCIMNCGKEIRRTNFFSRTPTEICAECVEGVQQRKREVQREVRERIEGLKRNTETHSRWGDADYQRPEYRVAPRRKGRDGA